MVVGPRGASFVGNLPKSRTIARSVMTSFVARRSNALIVARSIKKYQEKGELEAWLILNYLEDPIDLPLRYLLALLPRLRAWTKLEKAIYDAK